MINYTSTHAHTLSSLQSTNKDDRNIDEILRQGAADLFSLDEEVRHPRKLSVTAFFYFIYIIQCHSPIFLSTPSFLTLLICHLSCSSSLISSHLISPTPFLLILFSQLFTPFFLSSYSTHSILPLLLLSSTLLLLYSTLLTSFLSSYSPPTLLLRHHPAYQETSWRPTLITS